MNSLITAAPILLGVIVIMGFATQTYPNAYANGIKIGPNGPEIGDRVLELDINVPSSNETHTVMQFRLYDANTNRTIEHVTYLMNIAGVDERATDDNGTDAGKLLLSDFFYTNDGILTLQLEHVEGQDTIIIQGEKTDFMRAWIPDNKTGVLHATSPLLWNVGDDNRYLFNVTVFGIDKEIWIFPPGEEPVFEKVVTVPEFGFVAPFVMVTAIVGAIVAAMRFRVNKL